MLPPPLVDIARVQIVMAPKTYNDMCRRAYKEGGCSLIDRGFCIRPDRPNQRRQIQKLTWKDTVVAAATLPSTCDHHHQHHHLSYHQLQMIESHHQQQQQQQWMATKATSRNRSVGVSSRSKVNFDTGSNNNNNDGSSTPIAAVDDAANPRLALRRILALFENYQFREAANCLNRLDHVTFKAVLLDLPVDLFLEAMPKTLPLFEALYTKVSLADDLGLTVKQLLQPESLVMQMVKHFAKQDTDIHASVRSMPINYQGASYPSCKKILKVIAVAEPKMRPLLSSRRRALDKAIEGLGQHGLVGTSDESLMNLHDALRLEFDKIIHSYKAALQKLDDMSLVPKFGTITSRSVYHGPAPINASHQRQLSLKQNEIQERLIKNKTLLNAIEPIVENRSLSVFLGILKRRVEHDKDVLFQFTQLKREAKDVNPNSIVAPVLMRFSYGCDVVLHLLKEVSKDDGGGGGGDDQDNVSSDISGYHSDSDSAVMMNASGKSVRYNIFYASTRSTSRTSGRRSPSVTHTNSNADYHHTLETKSESSRSRGKYKKSDHVLAGSGPNGALPKGGSGSCPNCSAEGLPSPVYELEVKKEVEALRCDLMKARQTIVTLQDREHILKERLAEQAQKFIERGGCVSAAGSSGTSCSGGGGGGGGHSGHGGHLDGASLGEKRPTTLIRRYGNLYAQARVDTLDALDSLVELHDAEELKSKLLFSVIVLAFRSVHSSTREMRDNLRRLLQMPDAASADPFAAELEASVSAYLKKTVDRYDVKKNVEEVCSQIWATLYDYPCLKTCDGLVQYIRDCVKLAWGLVNQTPPFIIEYETRLFRRDMHVRFHTSNQESEHIKTYLWPALLETDKGPCVHKGVVIT